MRLGMLQCAASLCVLLLFVCRPVFLWLCVYFRYRLRTTDSAVGTPKPEQIPACARLALRPGDRVLRFTRPWLDLAMAGGKIAVEDACQEVLGSAALAMFWQMSAWATLSMWPRGEISRLDARSTRCPPMSCRNQNPGRPKILVE